MQILNKIVDNGTIVGYQVEDGQFTLPMCKKALYVEMYMNPLIQAGYKYYGYDADLIEDPSGVPICNHPAMDRNEVDELEWAASLDLASSSALSDAEASKFYTFREESAYKFKTEPTYQINTREEFIAYLEQAASTFFGVNYVTDNRPINYFVNPDALFTIDEVIEHPEYKKYFDIMVKRHHIRNYGTYTQLIEWLCEHGVLNTHTPTMAEFLSAYYAWGPEGIKDKCVRFETKLNVDGVFQFMKDPLTAPSAESYAFDNRVGKVSVVDAREGLHFLKTHESFNDITDVTDFKRARIIINSNNQLLAVRRSANVGKNYQAIAGTSYSDVSDRLYITLISESGYTYCYKVAHNKIKLGLAHSESNGAVYSSGVNFTLASAFPAVNLPIDVIENATDYYLWNLAIIKAVELVTAKSQKAPVRSTSEFMLKDGMNPVAVIDMISHSLSRNKEFNVNKRYTLSSNDDDMCNALELYLQDIPEYILSAFNLTEEDLENGIDSFLELADVDDLRDRREQMMDQKIGPGQQGFDETFKDYFAKYAKSQALVSQVSQLVGRSAKKYDAIDYYTKLRFVHDCLHGEISVDNFGDGIMADLGASYLLAAECMLSVIYAEYGNSVDRSLAEQAIAYMDTSDLIDINRIFKVRDNAYKGYMVDFAKYRKTRGCTNSWIWAYCTKVFREISNAPIEQQRPYLMELVVLENSKPDLLTRQLMTKCVEDAIEKAGLSEELFASDGPIATWNEKKCAMQSADWLAAQLFFYIYAGGVKSEPVNGVYHISMNMYDTRNLEIDIPENVYTFVRSFNKEIHKRYITVYDFCKYEYNPNTTTGTFNFCLVNANVDPWHVKPKKGYSIKSYSLLPNYYEQATLDKANGVGFYEGNYGTKAISVAPLIGAYRNQFIPTSELTEIMAYEDEVRHCYEPEPLYDYLNPEQHEYIFAYVRRWAMEKKKAQAEGKKLISIPLKQDIVYAPMAYSFCDEIPATSPIYSDDITVDDKACQKVTDVKNISWRDFFSTNTAIETKQVTVKEFAVNDINMDEAIAMQDILSGEYQVSTPITITGNYINVKGDNVFRIAVSRLTPEQIMQFANAGILRKVSDNKYFIRAINGDFMLEV